MKKYIEEDKMIRYTKEDFLDYAEAFGDNSLTYDEMTEARHEAWINYIKHWTLGELQVFFGFTHKNSWDGKEIFMKTDEEFKKWKEEND